MTTSIHTCYGTNSRQIKPAVVNLFQNNNAVDSIEFQIENYVQDNVNLSTLDPYVICHGNEFVGGLDEVKLTSEVTEDGILRVYWDLTLMTLSSPQTISAQLVFKNDDGAVWTSYKFVLFCNESLTADEEIVAQYPTILKQMERRIDDKTNEAAQGAVEDITNNVTAQVGDAMDAINDLAGQFDAGVIYIPYGEHIAPEHRIANRLYYQYTNGEHTQGRFEDYMGNVLVAEGSGGGGSSLPMFTPIWSDHLYNDASYLRADTFSWHNGDIYVTGYNTLLKEYNNENCVVETENGVTYKRSPNGFKIASADQHDNIRYVFEQTGSAWFYLLDTENKRFKLPREKAELQTQYPNTANVDVAVVGNGMALGLTDGTNNIGLFNQNINGWGIRANKTAYGTDVGTGVGTVQDTTNNSIGVTTEPTKSGLEGHGTADLTGIQTERINTNAKKYLYFYVGDYEREETEIEVGKLTEIINAFNNPFSLLDYKYSEYELNNISWLRSNGQYNSKAIYPAVYDLLLRIYNGVETKAGVSVKLSTETFDDYDFVLNTAEETFRLPLLDGSEDLVDYTSGIQLAVTAGLVWTAPQNGFVQMQGGSTSGISVHLGTSESGIEIAGYTANSSVSSGYIIPVNKRETYYFRNAVGRRQFFKAVGNGSLYYYVGETVQNANLINAGRIEETLATKTDKIQASRASMPSNKYIDLTLGASDSHYIAPADGWFMLRRKTTGSSYCHVALYNVVNEFSTKCTSTITTNTIACYLPVLSGDEVEVSYSSNSSLEYFRFYYAEGEI